MIILRTGIFSKLKDSRIGSGWTQDGNGKVNAEKYFKIGQLAADRAVEEGKSDEEVIKAAKKAAGKEATLDNLGKPAGKTLKRGAIAGVATYLIANSPDFIENNLNARGLNMPESAKKFLTAERKAKWAKNSKKYALGAAALGAGTVIAQEAPKIAKKRKAAQLGAEINTRDRLKKTKK